MTDAALSSAAVEDSSFEELLERHYPELRQLAGRALQRSRLRGRTMQASDLLHEVYLKLQDQNNVPANRGTLFALAARFLRWEIVNQLRRRQARAGSRHDPLTVSFELADGKGERTVDLLALEQAMEALEREDRQAAQIVELRFYLGLTHAQVAEALGISLRTAKRRWDESRGFLKWRLVGEESR